MGRKTMRNVRTIGFIGAGNMATALIRGLIQSEKYERDQIIASDIHEEALRKLKESFGLKTFTSNRDLVREAGVVVLSVKPQGMEGVLEGIKEEVGDRHLLISIAAGIPLSRIGDRLGREIPLIRVMPNTPALVLKGVSALSGGEKAGAEEMEIAREIFQSVGETVEVEERLMDAVTALSGSGPGYLFRIMECLVKAGVSVGLDEEISTRLVVQTFLGASVLAKESGERLSRLREQVTSPGGTTAAGLAVLERRGVEEMMRGAVLAAHERSIELGRKK
jgi:pyrroline-5-carboxylate reductase